MKICAQIDHQAHLLWLSNMTGELEPIAPRQFVHWIKLSMQSWLETLNLRNLDVQLVMSSWGNAVLNTAIPSSLHGHCHLVFLKFGLAFARMQAPTRSANQADSQLPMVTQTKAFWFHKCTVSVSLDMKWESTSGLATSRELKVLWRILTPDALYTTFFLTTICVVFCGTLLSALSTS